MLRKTQAARMQVSEFPWEPENPRVTHGPSNMLRRPEELSGPASEPRRGMATGFVSQFQYSASALSIDFIQVDNRVGGWVSPVVG